MSDNPLSPSPEHKKRVQARARQLWEADGAPADALEGYLERADELVRMGDAGNPGQLANPMTTTHAIVEEASIQDNLGEFPGGSRFQRKGCGRRTGINGGNWDEAATSLNAMKPSTLWKMRSP